MQFMLTAHLRQATTLLRRVKETEELWSRLEQIVARRSLPERAIPALWDAAMGYRVRNATYRAIFEESAEDPISEGVASRDLKQMVDAGLLRPEGEKRGRYYLASAELRAIRQEIVARRNPRDDADPFA
jgi:hypothetical protein